eukprot:COSAG02_NODE_17830_length_977_cov_1.980638_1_plen_322_part_10
MSKPATPLTTPRAGDAEPQQGGANDDAVAAATSRRLQRAQGLTHDHRYGPYEDPTDMIHKILGLAALHPQNLSLSSFDPVFFAQLTPLERNDLLRCMCNIDDPTATEIPGCSAIYVSDYDRFEPFFGAVLAKLRGANCLLHDCNKKLPSGWSNINDVNNTEALDVSKLGLPALQIICTIRRNLNDLSLLISSMEVDQMNEAAMALESRAVEIFESIPSLGGEYFSFSPSHEKFISESEFQELDSIRKIKELLPMVEVEYKLGCGVYVDMDRNNRLLLVKVGCKDHFEIVSSLRGTIINDPLERARCIVEMICFAENGVYGS